MIGAEIELPEDITCLQRALADDPGDVESREQLGEALLALDETDRGLAHLCVSAELRAELEQYSRAISLLKQVLEVSPRHEKARRLLPKFYRRVPRQPTGRVRAPTGLFPAVDESTPSADDGDLFALPPASVVALAQLLPFAEEDPPGVPRKTVLSLPLGATEAAGPLLAALDQELRRGSTAGLRRGVFERLTTNTTLEFPPEEAVVEAERTRESAQQMRVTPASSKLGIADLPPSPMISLLDSQPLKDLLDRVDVLLVHLGDSVGECDGGISRAVYIVLRGQFEIRRPAPGGGTLVLEVLNPGDSFGEVALLTGAEAITEVVASEPALVLELPLRVVDDIATQRPEVRELLWDTYFSRSFHAVMAGSPLFCDLPPEVISRISVELEPVLLQPGDIHLRCGQTPSGLYAVVSGSLLIMDGSTDPAVEIARLSAGEFFGDLAQLESEASPVTVLATEDTTLLWLARAELVALGESISGFAHALVAARPDPDWPYKLC